jgi:DNA-binding transcriptional ArsR family regulator
MSQGRDEDGKYTPSVSENEVLCALRDHPDPVVTVPELAERVDVSGETVRRHLSTLHDRGVVERKTVGARAVVWWIPDADGGAADTAPASPLRNLVGFVDEETAERARDRSREWRDAFDDELEAGDA